jgi:arylsulfatase A-like enzyme
VVLIDIDTMRPDRMGCYGYRRATTTHIDRWVEDHGVVFLDALAPSSWTPPSTTSMITGLAPHQHRVEDHDSGLATSTLSLASRLRAVGYETYSYVEGRFFGRKFGMDQGFDVNQANGGVERWMQALDLLRGRRSERPLFLFLHTYLVHAPYEWDPRFLSSLPTDNLQFAGKAVDYDNCIHPYSAGELELSDADKVHIEALYDAEIARMDDIVGGFLEELESALDGRSALVFLTADHGEEFWEHNGMGHGWTLYGELLRVPLLVRFPERGLRRPPVSRDPVSLLDIVPTVLDYAGLDVPPTLPGRSLRKTIPGPRLRVAQLRGTDHRAVQFDRWKLIRGAPTRRRWTPEPVELYDLAADPGEVDNLSAEQPVLVEELDRRWREYLRGYAVAVEAPPAAAPGSEELKSLRALGYVR